MSRKELQRYVLSHRGDQAAFYAYVDKLNAEANWIEMPPLSSVEDMDNPGSKRVCVGWLN